MIDHFEKSIPINMKPFNPFIILSPNDHVVLFFTQVFAEMTGFHPSVASSAISLPLVQKFNLEFQYNEILGCYEIQQLKKTGLNHKKYWIEELIHELRTASLTIDLGAHVLADSEHLAPVLLRKLLRASHRQKIATLIASDFLQLNTVSPSIHPISLVKILTSGLSHSPFTNQAKFFFSSSLEPGSIDHVNPIIWGNFYFLSNFFTTLFSWLETEHITLEMRTINPVSVKVTVSIPDDHFLSNIQGFSLIPHYLQYIVAYFNGCSWVTQNSIDILFPQVLVELSLDKIYSLP
ncbi:MAG: hypothetical protein ACFFAE_09700 [Candidatus Hodarchaeota archaeon]